MEKERDCQERQEGGGRHVRVNGEEQKKEEKQSYCRADFTVEQQTYSDEQPVCVHFVAVVLGVLSGLCVIFCGSAVLSTAFAREAQCPTDRAQPQTREEGQIRLVHNTLSSCPNQILPRKSDVSSVQMLRFPVCWRFLARTRSTDRTAPRHHCKNLEKDT